MWTWVPPHVLAHIYPSTPTHTPNSPLPKRALHIILGFYSAWVCLEVVGVGMAHCHLLASHGWCLDGWATVRAVAVRLVAKTPALTRRRHLPRRPYSARARTSGAAIWHLVLPQGLLCLAQFLSCKGRVLASRVGDTVHPHSRFFETMLVNALRVCSLHNIRCEFSKCCPHQIC